MSAIASWPRRHQPELIWAGFSAANVAAVVAVPGGETMPFHLVWISMAAVYTLRLWPLRSTLLALAAVSIATGAALAWAAHHNAAGLDEVTEVPLMAAMFLALVWHVHRRQVAMEQARKASEREVRFERERDLVRDATHELRTPITVARGYAELIKTTHEGDQAAEDAGVILDELGRLARISDRLLILAAAEHPGFLRREPIELERLIVETAKRWSVTADRAWSVNTTVDGVLLGDEERLEASLDALIENAIKFTSEGDCISLAALADAGMAVIEVSDSGMGIPERDLTKIFSRFARGANTADAPDPQGTGLGLAIVKAIVEAHGGSVGVESQIGQGTTFRISLPNFNPTGHAPPALAPAQAPAPAEPLTVVPRVQLQELSGA